MTDAPAYGDFPLKQHLGMALGGDEPGRATCRIEVGEHHLNPNGMVHGAVLFAMVDTAMGKAAMSVLDEGQFCATVDLQLRFVRPSSDHELVASVEVLKRGKHVLHLEGRVEDTHGRLIATASSTFAVITF